MFVVNCFTYTLQNQHLVWTTNQFERQISSFFKSKLVFKRRDPTWPQQGPKSPMVIPRIGVNTRYRNSTRGTFWNYELNQKQNVLQSLHLEASGRQNPHQKDASAVAHCIQSRPPVDLLHVCAAGSHLTRDHESLGDRAGTGESGGANGTKLFSTSGTCRGKFSLMVLELRSQPFNFMLLLQNATLVLFTTA